MHIEEVQRSINVMIDTTKRMYPGENFTDMISDGYHTFGELYNHRALLFLTICASYPDLAWKSKLHSDGTMYDGMFIVGINTPLGQATYHYDIDPYWEIYRDIKTVDMAPEYDGHTPEDALERIVSLSHQKLWYKNENPNKNLTWGKAFEYCKAGYSIARKGWNDKNLRVVYQKGYPDGIPCNTQTAAAWNMNEGDLFKCDPYLQINTTDGSHAMWVPSIRDLMATDWYVITARYVITA